VLLTLSSVVVASGCCFWHGGVCGCGCCDGKPTPSTCEGFPPNCITTTTTTLEPYTLSVEGGDKACVSDGDCTFVSTRCDYCECWGEPVNKAYAEKYHGVYRRLCADYAGGVCSMACRRFEIKCVDGTCVKVILPSWYSATQEYDAAEKLLNEDDCIAASEGVGKTTKLFQAIDLDSSLVGVFERISDETDYDFIDYLNKHLAEWGGGRTICDENGRQAPLVYLSIDRYNLRS
jgi:hypothetical protein